MDQDASVHFPTIDPSRLGPIVGEQRLSLLVEVAARTRERLDGRRVINVNSTATGGGVAELLYMLLGYARGVGIGTEWLVIRGNPEFFAITKRIHNWLYGVPGDRGRLGDAELRLYERTLGANAEAILDRVRPDDIVVVHDPQPAGLIPMLLERGARVAWRCHVGMDVGNEWSERAWSFLRRYVEPAEAHIFSRAAFAPSFVPRERLAVIAPSIDPFAPKNQALSRAHTLTILMDTGLIGSAGTHTPTGLVRMAYMLEEDVAPPHDAPLVVQISRWDHLKDMGGVLRGYVEHVPRASGAHLVLAGPAFAGVADDPESGQIWNAVVEQWRRLRPRDRARVHLALLPMEDAYENAVIVNALQRHAAIVVQKSLAEGFGLTVVEAMWKSRALVASAVGGIADQIVNGVSGVLIPDPHDLSSFGESLARLLADEPERRRLGRNARRRAARHFLPDRHLLDYARVLERLG